MNPAATTGELTVRAPGFLRVGPALAFPVVVASALWPAPPWVLMWGLAGALFLALKFITAATTTGAEPKRLAAYLFLWPGMDAQAFLRDRADRRPVAPPAELAWALAKMAGGLAAGVWAAQHAFTDRPVLVAWVGMVGLIFTLHFGFMHAVSWGWRRLGVNAPPIMRAPILADSLAALWGGRWNVAFADAARRLLLRPLAPRLGVKGAGAVIFLVSGLVHEVVTSLPARGGWGGPTLYFLLQAAGIAVEKSPAGRRLGLGAGFTGWLWMALITLAPLPLLFHRPFITQVIIPQFQFFHRFLP